MRSVKRHSVVQWATISLLFLTALFASTAQAQLVSQITSNGAVCGGDLTSYGNCTAGEISISQVTGTVYDNPWQGDQACVRGETVTALETTVEYSINTQARYDLLLWIGEQEGTDPRAPAAGDPAKSCLVASLPGPFPGGTGNNVFVDLETTDQCADINGGAAAAAESRIFTNLSVECQDNDTDGFADIQLLLTWSQNQNQSCGLGNGQSFPTNGANSKCDYQILNTTLEIVEPASLTIIKNTIGGDDTFQFATTGGLTGTSITTSGGTGSFTYTELRPIPDLTIFETLLPGSVWDATDITCTGATNNGTFTDSPTLPGITGIVIDEGQDVVCTVSNTKLANLTVVKNTSGDNGAFGFEGNNGIGLFTLDTGVTNTAQTTFSNLQPGTDYSLTETIPADWNLAAASCSSGGETADLDTGVVTGITLPAGGDVTCTFNNAKPGLSTITKTSVGGLGTFDFTITNAPPGTFSLTTTGSPSGGSSAPTGITLAAGQYVITENDPSAGGWTLTDIQCTEDGTQDSIIDIPNRQITLNVQDGETIACDVTNTKDGTVIVEKQTLPNGDPADFVFSGDLAGTLSDGEILTLSDNFTAAATSNETVIPGWDLTDITCTGGTSASSIQIGGTASFTQGDTDIAVLPAPGETITCVYTNTKLAQLTIVKHITATGPLVQDFSFTSDILGSETFTLSPVDPATDDQRVISGMDPGIYGVGEDPPGAFGWALTGASCGDGSLVTAINLSPGEELTCTFTNSPLGSATVIKNTVGGDDTFAFVGDDPILGFNLDTTITTGTASADFTNVLAAGTYDVVETPLPAGWMLTAVDCVDDATPNSSGDLGTATATINVDLAETVTCTFENTADAQLVIAKQTIPATDPTSFGFRSLITGQVWDSNGTIDTTLSNGTSDSLTSQPGPQFVSETPVSGYAITDIECIGDTNSFIEFAPSGADTFQTGDTSVEAVLAAGEVVTCTYTNTKQGSLTIVKATDGGDGEFSFTHDIPVPNAIIASPFTIDTAVDDTALLSDTLLPGVYTATETVPTGWELDFINCTSTGPDSTFVYGAAGGFTPGDKSVDVNLSSGEDVTCTFTNTKQATLIVEKLTDPNTSTQGFSFTGDVSGGPITHGQTLTTANITPGIYTSTETPVDGWELTDISCDDDASANPSTGDIATGIATFNADPGDVITCTFTNTIQPGAILVDKVTDPAGSDQLFDFTPSWGAGFSLADASAPYFSGPLLPSSEAGPYSISETEAAGWDLTSATCTGVGNTPAAINLQPGETVTCTFTNTIQRGNIVVDKVTSPLGSSQSFDFVTNYAPGGFSLTDAAPPNDSGDLLPTSESGTLYSVTENPVTGWTQTGVVCNGNVGGAKTPTAIDLMAGETVTCTFTNTVTPGKILVDKVTVPAGSSQSFAFVTNYGSGGFSLTDGAAPNDSGDLIPSAESGGSLYSVVESFTAGWTETSVVCNGDVGGAKTPGAIELLPTETVTCTFTNTIQPGQIVVDKQTAPTGSPQLFSFTLTGTGVNQAFDLADATTPYNSGDLLPTSENGSYNVSETLPVDWSQTSATCSDGSSPAAVDLSPGEVVTCTFQNAEAGTSTFTKVSVGGDDTFSFSSDTPGGDFSLTTVNGISPVTPIASLAAGTYTIVENALAGWDLTNLVCTESDTQDSTTDIPTRTITLRVQDGETINCTVTNTKQGSITVSKVTVPTGDPASFTFTGDAAGSINDGGTIVVSDLVPGQYTSVEGALAGWDLTDIQCDDGASTTPSSGDVGTLTATFNLDAGEDVICTFTNTLKPIINLAKTVTSGPTLEANGTYTVVYSIAATNTGGPGKYDIVDTFSPGAGITLNMATAVYVAGTENSQTGALGAYSNFVTGEDLEAGLNESWTVTANFSIDPALLDGTRACDPATPVANTGFYNAVTGSTTDVDPTDDQTCTGLEDPVINLAKTVNGPAVLQGDGSYNVAYTITATNTGGPGAYNLLDTFSTGAGITLNTATATYMAGTESTQTGTLGVYPNFVTSEGLAAGLNESWVVTANFAVDPALLDPASSSCDPTAPAVNTGFYNYVEGSATDSDLTDNETCTGLEDPIINLAKTVASGPTLEADGSYTVGYTIVATNTGGPGAYDITDTMSPGTGITVVTDATYPGLVYAGGETQTGTIATPPLANAGTWVTAEGLGEGASETWTVTASFTVDPALLDPATSSCDSTAPAVNTGFYNLVEGSVTDPNLTDNETCTGLDDPGINLAKTVASGPTLEADGTYTVVYTITATNTGGIGVYDLVDTFSPGTGITLNTADAVYMAGSEDSQTGTTAAYPNFVTDEGLGEGMDESWTVTANFTVDPATLDPATSSCDPAAPAINTGFYNYVEGSVTDRDLTDNETCTGLDDPGINLAKTVNGPATLEADGTYTVVYTITATNTGGLGVYDLVDTFLPGAGITLNTATAVYMAGSEDSQTGTTGAYPNFVTDEGLEAGLNESWTVTANFTIDLSQVTVESANCDVNDAGANNTGFNNSVAGSDSDTDLSDNEACTELLLPTITLVKAIDGGDALPTDFILTLTAADGVNDAGADYASGVSLLAKAGVAYTLSEAPDQVEDYVENGIACVDDASGLDAGHPVTLAEGQTVTCTLTNTLNEIIFDVLAEVCVDNAPYVNYDVTTTLGGANNVDITWIKNDGSDEVVESLMGQTASGQLLWPGAAVVNGVAVAWPGWSCDAQGENCVQVDDGLVPTMQLKFEINPESTMIVQYPPATVACGPRAPLPELLPVPVNNPVALLLLSLMMLATGWYFRPALMRKF